jgi:hypothetical protein
MVRFFKIAIFAIFLFSVSGCEGAEKYSLNQMQGAWWSSKDDPVAAFAINGNVLFGDWEGDFRCEIKKDFFYVDYGKNSGLDQSGITKQKIIHLTKDNLTLQDTEPPYTLHHYFKWDGNTR